MTLSRTICGWLCTALIAVTGCTSTNSSNTARSAKEQLLLSNAIDQSLNKVDFASFRGTRVFLDDKYVDCVDKNYIVASTRHRLLNSGAQMASSAETADVVLEMRSGGVGTDTTDAFIGTPELTLPGMMTLPEVRLITRSSQSASAKLGFVAYDPKTATSLGDGGVALSKSDDNNWFVMGVGPWQNGTLRKELDRSLKSGPNMPMHNHPVQVAFGTLPSGSPEAPNAFRLTGGKEEVTSEQ